MLALLLFHEWKKVHLLSPSGSMEGDIFIPVIIAARNEERDITQLPDCQAKQDYPPRKFEVIIVDAHSGGNTALEITRQAA